ncbi:dystonin isoform X6 [Ascaphus truei]|uniref:dystonin isoform X6 n=1 Tax=Ascaphus truei TaxID=8439 RepID=UPI003F5A9412
MIAAAFLVLLRPYSIQCALLLLLLTLGTIATVSFLCCWHRKLQKGRHPMKNVLGGRARSRGRTYAILRSHHFRSEGFRPSPRHLRRYARARVEEAKTPVEVEHSEQETPTPLRKRKIKKSSRVQPEFYQSVQVTPTRKPSSGTASYRCSMSSSADFSDDEEDCSQKSGSASPAPGDTLPWNLPRHERCKRKTPGAAVLDPAERAVLRIADERDKVQKKTFTKWINQHLMKVRKHVSDLYEDLRDGHNLISLLEALSGDTLPRERDFLKTLRLVSSSEACEYDQHEDMEDEDKGPREKGRMRFHRLQNVQIALDYLKKRQVKLVNIRNDDITDGNPKLTLGLIWTIILHFQISDIHVTGESEDMSAKEKLLLWTRQSSEGYGGIRCENFTTCWRDGRLFNAVIHRYRPDLIDMDTVAVQSNIVNLENAFYVAEKLGVTRLLDPEDVDVSSPDEKSVITYVSSMYDAFPKAPDGGEGISANDVEVKWIEYQNMVNYLIQWIRHHVTLMSDRTFPTTAIELKALYQQYLQFKEKEIPPKETEKAKIKHLYKLLEAWIEFGRIKLCQGYHPNDIEKEWGKLIIAMFEREKTIRPEIERLEMLQQLANRVQRDSLGCEDKLILARNALQSDTKRMESGIQFQNEAEIAGYIIECENLLRQQVVDVQALLDGKYYQADQLVQRVASLRDELLAVRNEYSSIYSKGRILTSEQTKLMISGITQSLNSGFSQSFNPAMNSSLSQSMTPTMTPSSLTPSYSHGFGSRLTPAITPTYTPSYNPGFMQNYVPGMDTNASQSRKLVQIKKPQLKSSFADQNLSEEEVNLKFVQDLLSWVEEMQMQLDRAEWGADLSSIESHQENHRNVHGAIEQFETSLKEANMSELQLTGSFRSNYSEVLRKVESQYSKLLNSTRNRKKHLDSLHNFVSRATRELIWLNEKEEEEVAYDWSERNQNIPAKKGYHTDLMRELDHKEEIIKSVQDIAEQMLLQNHPARSTIESYKAAMQTQWSWILQLCHCVEQHIRQNSAYFEYFNDAKEATEYLKNLKDSILRKYSCDKSSSVHKLEDLVQESMEEKEQLLQYKSTVASLVGRAKAIIQLKPRNPDSPLKASIPVKAICDYRQIEITIYKEDECVLASNSHRAKWKVISPTGNEAMVPSVCFTVPPLNKEAVDMASRIEQVFQSVLALWHESHINMKSLVSWHYLMNDIEAVRGSKVSLIKTLLPGEHQQVLSSLRSRFDDFLEDSQESKIFSVSDIGQLEREVNVCKLYYEELLKSAERVPTHAAEEQEESVYNLYVSDIRNIRLRLENCEERLIRQIRTPLDRDDLHESVLRISEQEKLKKEFDRLKDDLSAISDKCEEFFSQAAISPSAETLHTELNTVIQNMNQVYSMSSMYLEKLKTINLVLKNTQGAESLVKLFETRLCEEEAVTADRNTINTLVATLKQWRSEVDEKREVFHALEDELQKAKTISDQMFKVHRERDLDFDWHKEKADQLAERWQHVHSQIDNRLRDLDGISKSLKYFKESHLVLDSWMIEMEETQSKLQENLPDNSKALSKQLDQQKMLISEIEMKQNKMDECQKYSEQYSSTVKDYELQVMTYRALVDSHQKSPMKRRRLQSSSDFIVQEYMDLRTRYSALMTLITQHVRFSGDAFKRMEEEEKSLEEEKKEHVKKAGEILNWVSKVTKTLSRGGGQESAEMKPFSKPQISSDEISSKQEEMSGALQTLQLLLAKHGDRMTEMERLEIEKQVKALQEGQCVLSTEYERQQQEAKDLVDKLVEQKVDKVISGTIDEATGAVYSIYQSILQGLVDYETGIMLLEMQLIVSGIISPDLRMCFDLEDAINNTLIDEQISIRLQELSNAKKLISSRSSADFPIIAAFDEGLISETLAVKMIDTLLSCGCLYVPGTGEQMNLNKLFQRNLISTPFFSKLLERQKMGKDLIDPVTAEKLTLIEILQRTVINKPTGMRFLPINAQEKGKITLKSGRKISVLRAAHEGIMEREIMFKLLGAQIFSGGIIDPDSGKRMTLEESLEQGIIDQSTICGILTQQIQNGGILCPSTGKYLTVDEAVQCNLISYSSALLVLEAQRGFIGLIWPDTSEIFPISTSLQQGMISSELAHKILSNRQKIAGLYIPETSEILRLNIAAQLGVIENNTACVLSNLQLHDKMPNIDVLESSCKHALKWTSSYESHTSRFNELSEKQGLESEEPLTHNPEHTKQLFLSYLMINSYIDANTGERLLLFDGDLDEAVGMLLESENMVGTTWASDEEFTSVGDYYNDPHLNSSSVSGLDSEYTDTQGSSETISQLNEDNNAVAADTAKTNLAATGTDLANKYIKQSQRQVNDTASSYTSENKCSTLESSLGNTANIAFFDHEKEVESKQLEQFEIEHLDDTENEHKDDIKSELCKDFKEVNASSKQDSELCAALEANIDESKSFNVTENILDIPDNEMNAIDNRSHSCIQGNYVSVIYDHSVSDGNVQAADQHIVNRDIQLTSSIKHSGEESENQVYLVESNSLHSDEVEHIFHLNDSDCPESSCNNSDYDTPQHEDSNSDNDGYITPSNQEDELLTCNSSDDMNDNTLQAQKYIDNANTNEAQPAFDIDYKRGHPLEMSANVCENLQAICDYDTSSLEEDESEDDVGDITQNDDILEQMQGVREINVEDRTPTFTDTDTSSDEDFFCDIDADTMDMLKERQFLETILEEEAETTTCLEVQNMPLKERSLNMNGTVSLMNSVADACDRNTHGKEESEPGVEEDKMKDNTKYVAVKFAHKVEKEDEFSEGSCSEIDIDCQVSDETSSDEDYDINKDYQNEHNQAYQIDENTYFLCSLSNKSSDNKLADEMDCEFQRNNDCDTNDETTIETFHNFNHSELMNEGNTVHLTCEHSEQLVDSKDEQVEECNGIHKQHYKEEASESTRNDTVTHHISKEEVARAEHTSHTGQTFSSNASNIISKPVLPGADKIHIVDISKLCREEQSESNTCITDKKCDTDLPDDNQSNREETIQENIDYTELTVDKEVKCTPNDLSLIEIKVLSNNFFEGNLFSTANDNEICKIIENLEETKEFSGIAADKDNIAQFPTKSPIHIDNLNVIFDSTVNKTCNDDLVSSTCRAVIGTSMETCNISAHIDPENTNEIGDLASYLKGCVGAIHIKQPSREESCSLEENVGIFVGHKSAISDARDDSNETLPIDSSSLCSGLSVTGIVEPEVKSGAFVTNISSHDAVDGHTIQMNKRTEENTGNWLIKENKDSSFLGEYLSDSHAFMPISASDGELDIYKSNLSGEKRNTTSAQVKKEPVNNNQLSPSPKAHNNTLIEEELKILKGNVGESDEQGECPSNSYILMQEVIGLNGKTQEENGSLQQLDYSEKDNDIHEVSSTHGEKTRDNESFLLPDKHGSDSSLDFIQVHTNQKTAETLITDSDDATFEEQQVLEPNHPKLISSQLEQIFHILPDVENADKLEELMINLNKGLFPNERIVFSCKSESLERQTDDPTVNKIYQDYKSIQPLCGAEDMAKNPVPEQINTEEKSQGDGPETLNISQGNPVNIPKMKEVLECSLTDKVPKELCHSTQKLCELLTLVQDLKFHLNSLPPISDNLETLKIQLEKLKSFESRLNLFSVTLRKDLNFAEQFLMSMSEELPGEHLKELKISYDCLQKAFAAVCEMSSNRAKQIAFAVDSEMSKLAESHKELLSRLQLLSDWIAVNNDSMDFSLMNTNDVETVKQSLQSLKNVGKRLSEQKIELETTAFDIQFFISEHAQDLSPNQSKLLLRLLNTTQKSFHEAQKKITSQMDSLKSHLLAAQDLNEQKDAAVQLQEHKEKLQEICALLTQTENRLIGQQDIFSVGDSPAELQHYQTEYEELQKDMQAGASELAEIVKNTERFLQEHGDKLSQEDRDVIKQKLKEAKNKFELLSKKAEESKKELEKAVTTAIKQETEKFAAVEQLEESKSKIESLLGWLSHVDKEAENGNRVAKHKIQQNGKHHKDGDFKSRLGSVEEVNGNLIQPDGRGSSMDEQPQKKDLSSQYEKVKAQHEKIVSQHQAVIIATQSAQALLEKQGSYLAPEEREKLQKDMEELKAQYDTTLCDSERKIKLMQTVQEELEKFTVDYSEFENWLHESKEEFEDLESGAADFCGVTAKLQRQKSFSEDVISHKGDLRYITISGQRVLDAAKSCNKDDDIKEENNNINTLEIRRMVQSKLDTASEHFKSLYSKCNVLGNNLKDLVDKYQHYKDASSGLRSGLQATETAVNKRLSEPIAADTKNLQRQLEDTKVLYEQVSIHLVAVEKLKKAADGLLDTQGGLLLNKSEIQKPLEDIMERYNNLSQSVNDWNEKLQITLTRSLSVQEGLDEMLDWMEEVEKDLKDQRQVPLNSSSIQEIITKNNMLDQDISSRQSSVNAMNDKVNKFMETADPSTASSLQGKMSELSERFSKASKQNRERVVQMEDLKTKVEQFENLSGKVQTFLDKKFQALAETDGPGKDVTELSQYMQETSTELIHHKKDMEDLQKLLEELCVYGAPGDKALVWEKVNTLLKKFQDLEETVKAKEEDVSSCQNQMDAFKSLVHSLKHWFTSVTEKIPAGPPTLCIENVCKHLKESKNLQEEWTSKGPEVQKVNSKGTILSNLISAVTSPLKTRATLKSGRTVVNGGVSTSDVQDHFTNKELVTVQKEMSDVNQGYEHLGVLLKEKVCELETRLSHMQQVQKETGAMMQWLEKMQAAAAAWEAPTDSDAVKAQIEQQKVFASELKQNESKVQKLKDKLKGLLESNPNAPESYKWKEMLDKIDSSWKGISQLTAERQQTLEESSNYLTQFQTAEAQLKQWLVEKELMASVLGPLSIDPNMLKTQKQQVQILLKEFDARNQQYEQLNTAGQRILNRPGELPPCDEVVKDQLAAVARKWESLTGQLNERCDRIDQAIVKSTLYQSLLKGLSDKLSALNSKLSSSMTVSTHPDAVKHKLQTASEVQEEIKQEMKNIQDAKVLCEELSDLVAEAYLKEELHRQMDAIVKPFIDLENKAGYHIEQLQSAFASSQKFHQMSEDFQSWLQNKRKEQNEAALISSKLDILKSLITEQKAFQNVLNNQRSTYDKTATEGESLLQKTEGEEKVKLQSQLATLKCDWAEINKQVLERQHNLIDCQQKAMKHKELVENIQPWIDEYQNKLSEVKISMDPVAIENSIGQVKVFQKNVDKQRGMVEMLNSAADSLLSACQIDKEIITEKNAKMNQQVELLIDNLHNKRDSLESMALRLKDFQESIKETERQLKVAHEHLEAHDSLGAQACSNKHLTIMQTQQKALQNLKPHIELAKRLAQELVVDASDAEGVSDLLLQAECLQQKHNVTSQRVEEKCSFLETKLQGIGHFQNSIREMFSQFAEFDDELDSMSPVGSDPITLQSQKQDIKTFLKKLADLITSNENANKTCKMILATESSPDLIGIKRDLEALNKQCNKLLDRAKTREEQIESLINRTEEFYSTLKEFVDLIGRVEEHEDSQGAVGMETDVINHQLNIFTAFQKEEIEPLQVRLQEVNWLGQGLIQSAGKNVSTQSLEHELEEVNTRWNTLNKKVAQRAAQLQEALLHCGRFQDALESLLSWLTDTEDLVANQKPPSAEFKVVKAQIQEQKLLQRLLDDRKPTVHVIKREGEKIAKSAEQADKEKILKQLSVLDNRWDELLKKAEIRNRQLDGILVVAETFHDALEPLSEWLTITEKKLANAEPIGTQSLKLLQQIAQQKLLQEDIVLRKQNVDRAIQNGLEVLKQTTGDDIVVIQEKLDGIKSRYSDITKLSSKVSKDLEQALHLATQFQSTHVELGKWLDTVEVELKEYETQDHKREELNVERERQKVLKQEAKTHKALLDSLNAVSSALLELVPWRAREGLDRMVTEDNERYRLVNDTVTQMVEEIDAARLRSQQFEQAVGAERTWIEETENKMMSLGNIRLEQDQTTAQLQVQKGFTMEMLRHKNTIDELVASGEEIMNAFNEEEKQSMKNKLEYLMMKYDEVYHWNAERNLQLERAVSLVNQFWETYEELWPWLVETEGVISQLPAPALNYDTLKQQQEDIRQLRELIAEHKPHIDKMNKTGPQLLELSPEEGFSIQEKYVSADALYSEVKEDVKKRAVALDEAISQSAQFHDKIDPTLESLQRIAERLRQPPSISAECEKIREQISETKNVSVELEKLQPVYETLKMRGEEMIARSEGADKDISAKAVQDKLDQMVFIWTDIQALAEEREAQLLDVIELAEKFWCDHVALIATIKDTQDFIRELEEPGVDPSVVKQQQEATEVIREEIDGLEEELDVVVNLGTELIAACGEPDKPVVNKNIDELNSAWDTLNKTWNERVDKLDEAMQYAVQYQDGLQALFDWVDIAAGKIETMSPVGTDLEMVKQQIVELKQFKTGAYQQQIEMERLNHQKEWLLKKVTDENDKCAVEDPLTELKLLWGTLEKKIINRQHKLEGALLALGPFQHALDELLMWLTHTEELLNEQKPIGGDPKTIEIELAKHHVLQNDVLAHKSTVETVKKAGNDLIESSAGEEASSLQSRLEALNQRWQNVLKNTEQRRKQLDSALFQAQGFHSEIEEMYQWLKDTERQLFASKPVGGLPETARDQLNTHLELCAVFEAKEEVYKNIMLKGQHTVARCTESPETNIDQDINNLKEKWESVETKLSERKTKLEEALNLATVFHNSLQDFINWLTQAEQTLTMASPASLILDTVLFQIDEHKIFVTEVNSHRDQIIELDKTGTHLKYFSQKQDVVLIKNLLISVQSRWENVVQRSLERGRALDDARKRSKQFHEAFNKLMEWLEESENALDSELEIANDPDKIKTQLTMHKEFQKTLGAKHSVYDTTTRSGRSLKEKASLTDDIQKLDYMLSETKDKWDTVCGKSVERQNKLEEALLFSGQFTDALQALIDWLYRVEPQMAEDQPVHGDIDIVMNLIDSHKAFQKELGKRSGSIQALKRSAKELIEGSSDDSSWVKAQMQELSTRWETVCTLSVSKQIRLEEALRQAEEFHSAVHTLLEWLAEAEQALRFHGVLPEDEESLRSLIDLHKEFMRKVEEQRTELNKGANMGEAILATCHPDSITTIKHWITIIKARFEEVLTWAKQHHQRLAVALADLISKKELLESLLAWLQWAEARLNEKDKEDIPEEIDEVKALIAEHQTFMEEMTRKQPDVDKVTKTYKRKAAESTSAQSQIPVFGKGRACRKRSPVTGLYPSGAQAQIETKNPRLNLLVSKWQQVWLLALERRRNLNDALDRLEELREFANFDFDVWRKKYMRWMNHKKSRVMDFFRRIDKDQDGKITRQEFIEGILSSKFPTSRLEMSAVADIFDRDGDGYIDYYEFVAALHPNKDAYKPLTDADKIEDEVTRQVAKCKCAKRFQVEQIGENKYRFFLGNQFGDSQQLRLVRILRSTVMVRVGGGWMALDEFLVKNDPCRAKGRTNMELREKFMLPDGASQSMTPFRPKGRRSQPSSRGASPIRSNSSPNIQAGPSQATATSTPKTPLQLTRNYGKPWLTNSKTSTPCRSPESPEYQLASAEGTLIQGSKLRLPGYLSGKGFQSGEDTSLLTTAATKVRTQFADYRKTPTRTGSKAGSRSSSRRGSDASDFDISEIQSIYSDMSETVLNSSRPSPRASSRSATGKPTKIPTPQRQSPISKLSKSTKR